ncbi:hypothetical protein Ancab_028077 [Ancistrocladus abbreviatus]
MSRCVPFPPPGYVWKVSGETLVELLQIRREWAIAQKRLNKKHRKRQRRKEENPREKRSIKTKEHIRNKRSGHKRSKMIVSGNDSQKEGRCGTFSYKSNLSEEVEMSEFIANWVPTPIQTENYYHDDQDWLYKAMLPEKKAGKECRVSSDDLSCGSFSLYPSAQYLPQVDSYALPYTFAF